MITLCKGPCPDGGGETDGCLALRLLRRGRKGDRWQDVVRADVFGQTPNNLVREVADRPAPSRNRP